jgi:hypothetical protein
MAKNVHGVPKKAWAKWNKDEQAAFNRMWEMLPAPAKESMLVPGTKLTIKEQRTLRWNICWLAADLLKCWRGFWGYEK